MKEPRWLSLKTVLAIHKDQIDQFGGLMQVRDKGLLESALMRPQNLRQYDAEANIFQLAASYGLGLAKNHPFVDGNKRVAFMAMFVFLGLNEWEIEAKESAVVEIMVQVADGTAGEAELTAWLKANSVQK